MNDAPGEVEPIALPLLDRFDAAGWTGEVRNDDYFGRDRRTLIGPAIMLIILIGLASSSLMFQLAVALPIFFALIYFLCAYQVNHLRIRITRSLVTFSSTPMWLPSRPPLRTAQLFGFEVVEIKVRIRGDQERVETPLWEIIAVLGDDVKRPVHLPLAFRQPRPAQAVAARLNWALSRVRDGQVSVLSSHFGTGSG
jgi:hypothetical protein